MDAGFSFGHRVVLTRVYSGGRVINSGLRRTHLRKPVTHVHFTNEKTAPHRHLISCVDPVTSEQTVREDATFIQFRHSWCKVFVESSYELVQCRRSQLARLDPRKPEHQKILKFPKPVTQTEVDVTLKHVQRWIGTGVSKCAQFCTVCSSE